MPLEYPPTTHDKMGGSINTPPLGQYHPRPQYTHTTQILTKPTQNQLKTNMMYFHLTRLKWLWERYNQNQTHHMIYFLNSSSQDFATEILWLTQRYVTILPKRTPKKHNPNNSHQTLHPPSLNRNMQHKTHTTPHPSCAQ